MPEPIVAPPEPVLTKTFIPADLPEPSFADDMGFWISRSFVQTRC